MVLRRRRTHPTGSARRSPAGPARDSDPAARRSWSETAAAAASSAPAARPPRFSRPARHHVSTLAPEIHGDHAGGERRFERGPALEAPALGELETALLDRLEILRHGDQDGGGRREVHGFPDGLVPGQPQHHDRLADGRPCPWPIQPPFGLEPVGWQATVELVFHLPVVVPIVQARDASQPVAIDVRVAGLQRIEGPGHQRIAEPPRVITLSLLELEADPGATELRDDTELMRAQPELPVALARKPEAKANQPAVGKKGAVHQATVELHREQQFARHHVTLRGAPDVPAQRLAGSELSLGAGEPHLHLLASRRAG